MAESFQPVTLELARTETPHNTTSGRGRWEDYEEKREHKRSGRVCLFGVSCNYGTDDPFFLSLLAIALRATW